MRQPSLERGTSHPGLGAGAGEERGRFPSCFCYCCYCCYFYYCYYCYCCYYYYYCYYCYYYYCYCYTCAL